MDITNIQTAVTAVTGITYEQMKQDTRLSEIVSARQWVFYFAKGNLKSIGSRFGRDHATVVYARRAKANLMDVCKQTRAEHDQIYQLMTGEVMDFVI